MNIDVLKRLAGPAAEFGAALQEMGWVRRVPTLAPAAFQGAARAHLSPRLLSAGCVDGANAHIYRLEINSHKWQDAVAAVESHLKREPQFAVVFCPLPGALLILAPASPEKAAQSSRSGVVMDRLYLDLRQPGNYEGEVVQRLMAAPKGRFRARLQELVNTEKVTKKFYDRFKKELDAFDGLIAGIPAGDDRRWYSSVMLNRLMFIYFLQRKGFLAADRDYLSARLHLVQWTRGPGKFQSFYRSFLLRLFHEGLGSREQAADFEDLMGKVPYLNGGLFDVHSIEARYASPAGEPGIDIPDDAFEKVFAFFDSYEWRLDTRPGRPENEINPDVLGYIFEKYINQKQMGAYYTKEDITEYISKNTIIPFLFDAAGLGHRPAGEFPWPLLAAEPDRYIYDAVLKGVDLELPSEIAAGVNPPTLHQTVGEGPVQTLELRRGWNVPAPEEYALPTEIWREVVARRTRAEDIRRKLRAGEVTGIDDLITLNLNIRQFALDAVERADDPEFIRSLWKRMAGRPRLEGQTWDATPPISVLDPTCGSGAFLFAALGILEPLYEACLDRMQEMVARADAEGRPRRHPDFRAVLGQVNDRARHPNRDYFVLKSIILNNLYGVDIMDEAVEICKLRLFLKLASVVEPDPERENYGLEPLPDMDFNIKAGNTLVGFATTDDVRKALDSGKQLTLDLDPAGSRSEAFDRINNLAKAARLAYDLFRSQQMDYGGAVTGEDKAELQGRLKALDAELDAYLARAYDIDAENDPAGFQQWQASHKPFHWYVEFFGIMDRGGFDVIIGNPPWKEYAQAARDYTVRGYATESCGNLHAICTERALVLARPGGFCSFIVQLPLMSAKRMAPVREALRGASLSVWMAPFDDRPGKLFEGLQHCRSVIFVTRVTTGGSAATISTTGFHRWATAARGVLFDQVSYVLFPAALSHAGAAAKCAAPRHAQVLSRLLGLRGSSVGSILKPRAAPAYAFYQEATLYWVKASSGMPYYAKDGRVGPIPHGRYLYTGDDTTAQRVAAIMHSSLFYLYFVTYGDCFHLSDALATEFPIPECALTDEELPELGGRLMDDLELHASRQTIRTHDGHAITYDEYSAGQSKPIIDEIDRVLARHYGFTEEELDFIINYDIKYRMGINGSGGGDGDDGGEDA
jgi:hypothetical protein